MEGDAIIKAEWAVYDPQSPANPRPFRENGSSAKRLAIVANVHEARQLSGSEIDVDVLQMATALLDKEQADVVVVKRGPLGCAVVAKSTQKKVPPRITRSVWPIGSGDIFAAVFAHYWAEEGLSPVIAAEKASSATAWYSFNKNLPIPRDPEVEELFQAPAQFPEEPKQIYVAGPFFTMPQRWMVDQVRSALCGYARVFSPYHDVGHGPAEAVAPADIRGLEESDVVLALLDGLDPGTLFEIGYASKLGLPIVVFAEHVGEEDAKMMLGSGCLLLNDFSTAIYVAIWMAVFRQ